MSSITDQATGTIIKSDSTGRTRYTRRYKQVVLAAFESSSLSAPDFAKQCGIKYPTMAAWIASRKRGGQTPARVNAPASSLPNWHQSPKAQHLKSDCLVARSPALRTWSRSVCSSL